MSRGVVAVAVLCFGLMLGSILYSRRSAHALPDAWFEGAGGYDQALRASRESGAPLLVYFHTDWCGYCKRMERDLWPAPAVDKQLRGMVKVRLNPERSSAEESLRQRYGVRGYPSLFVERGGEPVRVSAFTQVSGVWVMATPEELVAALR